MNIEILRGMLLQIEGSAKDDVCFKVSRVAQAELEILKTAFDQEHARAERLMGERDDNAFLHETAMGSIATLEAKLHAPHRKEGEAMKTPKQKDSGLAILKDLASRMCSQEEDGDEKCEDYFIEAGLKPDDHKGHHCLPHQARRFLKDKK